MRFLKQLIPLLFYSSSLFSQASKEEVLNEVYDACFLKEYKHIYLYYYEQQCTYRGFINIENQYRCIDCNPPKDSTLFDKFIVKIPQKVIDSVRSIEALIDEDLLSPDTVRNLKWSFDKRTKRIKVTHDYQIEPQITWVGEDERKWSKKKLIAKYQKVFDAFYNKPKEDKTVFHITAPIYFSIDNRRYFICQIDLHFNQEQKGSVYERRALLFEYKENKWKNIQVLRFNNYGSDF